MRRGDIPNPSGELNTSNVAASSLKLSSPSPIPMKTRLSGRRPARLQPSRNSSRISPAARLRISPSRPLAQKRHCTGHPTCVDKQKVNRSSAGINTISIVSPSCKVSSSFSVPSPEPAVSVTAVPGARNSFPINSRTGSGKLFIRSGSTIPFLYTQSAI